MEQQLKQRLVGAVVLVSLAVIFIPIILEGPGEEWTARSNNIPQPPPVDFRNAAELPLPAAGEPAYEEAVNEQAALPEPVPSVPDAPEPAPPPVAAAEAAPEEPPARPSPPASRAAEKSGTTASATPASGWYAQVGSFSQHANADGLRDRLVKAGYAAQLQQTDTGKGSSYRVLVGPEKSRAGAEQLLRKLVSDQQLKGLVIELSATAG
jgi:DedD protein